MFAMALFTYTSLGFIPLWQGFYEVDLMNFYVGQLLAHSSSPWSALILGWHPWSLCRAAGYFFLTFEVTSVSFERLTGRQMSTPGSRRLRWAAGISFLLLDGATKYLLLDAVRKSLAENLA
jgi:hypothetical protein